MKPCVTDFEILSTICQRGGTSIEPRSRFAARLRCLGLGCLVGLERRHQRVELGDPFAFAIQSLAGLRNGVLQCLDLGLHVAALALHTSQCRRTGREAGIVSVELPAELRLATACGVEIDPSHLFRSASALDLRRRDAEALLRFLQRRRGSSAAGDTDAPACGAESIAVVGDHHCMRVRDRDIDRVGPRRDTDGRADDRVQQLGDAGLLTAHMRPDRDAVSNWGGGGTGRSTECDHRTVHVRCVERVECPTTCLWRRDDDGIQRLAQRRLDGGLPACVDVDQIQQRAENLVDPGEMFGPGPGPRTLKCEMECLGSCTPTRRIVGSCLSSRDGRVARAVLLRRVESQPPRGRRRGRPRRPEPARTRHAVARRRHRGEPLARAACRGVFAVVAARCRLDRRCRATNAARHEPRPQHWPPNCWRRRCRSYINACCRSEPNSSSSLASVSASGPSRRRSSATFSSSTRRLLASDSRLATTPESISCPRSRSIERRRSTSTAAMPRARSRNCSTRTISSERSMIAACCQFRLGSHDTGVERGQFGSELLLGGVQRDLLGSESSQPSALRCDLAPAQVDLQRGELGDQIAVATCRVGLTLERSQLSADLAKQILHAQQTGLGRVEPSLCSLLAAPELQHTCGFFDDRTALLWPGIEHGVDLSLADDHVLLPSDARVAQQFLHVEQATRDAVDRVLALAGAEQDARHRDLGELDRQQPGRVVDRQAHLGPTEGGPLGGAGKDDVVHLLAAHRARSLRTENPGDCIDHVRLTRAVGPDHHCHPRLELQGGCVGERLESFEGQRLQEHGARDHSRASRFACGDPAHPFRHPPALPDAPPPQPIWLPTALICPAHAGSWHPDPKPRRAPLRSGCQPLPRPGSQLELGTQIRRIGMKKVRCEQLG